MVGYKIRKALRSTVAEVGSSHGLSLWRILVCNINTAASWAGGQESAKKASIGRVYKQGGVCGFRICGSEFENGCWMPVAQMARIDCQ